MMIKKKKKKKKIKKPKTKDNLNKIWLDNTDDNEEEYKLAFPVSHWDKEEKLLSHNDKEEKLGYKSRHKFSPSWTISLKRENEFKKGNNDNFYKKCETNKTENSWISK
jgi:hypothetical protein